MTEREGPFERQPRFGPALAKKIGGIANRLVDPESWWLHRHVQAATFMESRVGRPRALLVPAARHPLNNGHIPNGLFQAHLLAAAERAVELADAGVGVEIYVPGSLHQHKGVVDDISLATAGMNFLRSCDLPPQVALKGEVLNQHYKGSAGVYNSADEACVAAWYFKDNSDFGAMEVFGGQEQARRWQLHAIANGVLPSITVVSEPSPSPQGRALAAYTFYLDPTWQAAASPMGALSRWQRQPRPDEAYGDSFDT